MVLEGTVLGLGVIALVVLVIVSKSVVETLVLFRLAVSRTMNELDCYHVWDVVEKGVMITLGQMDRVKKGKAEMSASGMQYAQTIISDVLLQQGYDLKQYNIEGMITGMCYKYRVSL